jgi:hypothetical protein
VEDVSDVVAYYREASTVRGVQLLRLRKLIE